MLIFLQFLASSVGSYKPHQTVVRTVFCKVVLILAIPVACKQTKPGCICLPVSPVQDAKVQKEKAEEIQKDYRVTFFHHTFPVFSSWLLDFLRKSCLSLCWISPLFCGSTLLPFISAFPCRTSGSNSSLSLCNRGVWKGAASWSHWPLLTCSCWHAKKEFPNLLELQPCL